MSNPHVPNVATGYKPLVSCVVPVFNGEPFLAEALESILAQTYRPIEIIVADDGSTDGTRGIAQAFGEQIRFETQPTAGPAETRNLGIRAARGELIAFLDADDLWYPEKLWRQIASLRERPEREACVTHVQLFWTPDLEAERQQYRDHPRAQPVPGYASTTLLARRRAFDKVGLFNRELWFSDATEWFIRAREQQVQNRAAAGCAGVPPYARAESDPKTLSSQPPGIREGGQRVSGPPAPKEPRSGCGECRVFRCRLFK